MRDQLKSWSRAAGLEQELETSKQKVALLTRENQNLQEELSEAYRLKSRLAEVFKAAVEKNSQVEKEVKYYQGEVAAALAARDKAIVEVSNLLEVFMGLLAFLNM
jgi:regulator of replication initiation timing